MKNITYIIFICFLGLTSCKSEEIKTNTVDFNFTYLTPNSVKFDAVVTGYYDVIEWVINEKSTSYTTSITQNFPLKGTYDITLKLWIGNTPNIINKKITIDQDENITPSWIEEFNESTLNKAFWTVETDIHVNNELQQYTASGNYELKNGVLTIICKKVNSAGIYGSYTSARLKTESKKLFKYGRLEARLKLPKGKGTWPAFWLLGERIGQGTNWPKCGEIDIMEYVGVDPLWVQASLHSQSQFGGNSRNGRLQFASNNDEAQWHIYGMNWTTSKLEFYVDDASKPYYTCNAPSVKTADNWPFDANYFLILNLAFGGDWGGYNGVDASIDTMKFEVDWVKYYAL